ncbi:MAG: Glucose--fructose oxidoreductase precursor [candidate division BRC1 bacterium ADurb.BinA364]|nr:MAG: Glucose--fructose oxidoreductase precursor [candidate division BRC1 bacterium ADurb.BinA364]
MGQFVRVGFVGCEGIARTHLDYIGQIQGARLAAICDVDADALCAAEARTGARGFPSHQAMFRSGEIDAVVICAPHPFHAPIAIDAFAAGLHVLCEKPLAVHAKEARGILEAAQASPGSVFGVMFQNRTFPILRKAKELVDAGELGPMLRVTCIDTDWYRTQLYYDSGAWRGTWKGEGGGVLLNQCPHRLDTLVWLCGMPKRVFAFCHFGARHDIEVEDEVSAVMQFENGALGQFAASTGEAPGTRHFEIAFDRGALSIDDKKSLRLRLNRQSTIEHIQTAESRFEMPECWEIDIPAPPQPSLPSPHFPLMQNFVDAIRKGERLIAPGAEAIQELALGNAILLSAHLGRPVDLPVDEDAVEAMLEECKARSTFKKRRVVRSDGSDLATSFH